MATVSERARELATKMRDECYTSENWITQAKSSCDLAKAISHFEQALLAERRLAMEFCAGIADAEAATCCEDNQWKMPGSCSMGAIHNTANRIAKGVRAAAEKEVGNTRIG